MPPSNRRGVFTYLFMDINDPTVFKAWCASFSFVMTIELFFSFFLLYRLSLLRNIQSKRKKVYIQLEINSTLFCSTISMLFTTYSLPVIQSVLFTYTSSFSYFAPQLSKPKLLLRKFSIIQKPPPRLKFLSFLILIFFHFISSLQTESAYLPTYLSIRLFHRPWSHPIPSHPLLITTYSPTAETLHTYVIVP